MADAVEKVASGIAGFDLISLGGLPKGRSTLVAGSAGSAKTVFAAQFLVEGIRQFDEPGVFVTFEESPSDIRRNLASFGWDVSRWENEGRWKFVDASPLLDEETVVSGTYDLSGLLTRIAHAVEQVGATRVSLDSIGAIFYQFDEAALIRSELFRVAAALRRMGVTSVITAERSDEYGFVSRYRVEENVTDNVMILRNVLDEEKRRRTMEILKFRGTDHQKGEYPFTVVPGEGIIMIPLSAMELKQRSSMVRIASGNDVLDEMCGGGFFRDSIILVSGATGTGKTLMVTKVLEAGCRAGERALVFAFEESRGQLFRNGAGWGVDFERMERDGLLRVVADYPEVASLEDHLIRIRNAIDEFEPNRIAVDSLSAVARIASQRGFREFVIALTSHIKHKEIAGLFTSTSSDLMGGTSVTDGHISTITDSIILLRYVETLGETRRGLTVLKMRGSTHDKRIREFEIDGSGMHIGRSFRNITGILGGNPVHLTRHELDPLDSLFEAE